MSACRYAKLNLCLPTLICIGVVLTIYAALVADGRWVLPGPADPAEYLAPASWGSAFGYWPYADRILMLVLLHGAVRLFGDPLLAGAAFIFIVNSLIIALAMRWADRGAGPWAGLFTGILLLTCFPMLAWATYLYPDQLVALWVLGCGYLFFSPGSREPGPGPRRLLAVGVLAAFAALTKATGAAAFVLFGGLLLWRSEWRSFLWLCLGTGLGTLATLALYMLIFGWDGLTYVCSEFFARPQIWGAQRSQSNLVSYLDLLLNQRFFPLSLALLVCAGAWRDKISRAPFLVAAGSLAFLCGIYAFTHRGGWPVNTYAYLFFPPAAVGLGMYLGRSCVPVDPRPRRGGWLLLLAASALFLLVLCGERIGSWHPVWPRFEPGMIMLYVSPNGVFSAGAAFDFPEPVRWLYSLGPLLVLALLILHEVWRSRAAALVFMAAVALWGMAYSGGASKIMNAYLKAESDDAILAARLIMSAPASSFGVYVGPWRERHVRFEDVLLPLEGWRRGMPGGHTLERRFQHPPVRAVDAGRVAQGLETIPGGMLLTDNPMALPGVEVIEPPLWRGAWRGHSLGLYALRDSSSLLALKALAGNGGSNGPYGEAFACDRVTGNYWHSPSCLEPHDVRLDFAFEAEAGPSLVSILPGYGPYAESLPASITLSTSEDGRTWEALVVGVALDPTPGKWTNIRLPVKPARYLRLSGPARVDRHSRYYAIIAEIMVFADGSDPERDVARMDELRCDGR